MNLGDQVAKKVGLHHHKLGEQCRCCRFELFGVISARAVPNLFVALMKIIDGVQVHVLIVPAK
jgi:hypothetical protein